MGREKRYSFAFFDLTLDAKNLWFLSCVKYSMIPELKLLMEFSYVFKIFIEDQTRVEMDNREYFKQDAPWSNRSTTSMFRETTGFPSF